MEIEILVVVGMFSPVRVLGTHSGVGVSLVAGSLVVGTRLDCTRGMVSGDRENYP